MEFSTLDNCNDISNLGVNFLGMDNDKAEMT